MLDWMLDPPEPTAEEIFIERYLEDVDFDEIENEVRNLYPDVNDEKKFWQLVDEYACREAEKAWQEQEKERLEEWADARYCELYGY